MQIIYMSNISENDLVYHKEGDIIYSGGFNINSIMMKKGISPIFTLNHLKGGNSSSSNVSDIFNDLAIPSGLLFLNEKFGGNKNNEYTEEYIGDDIHSELLKLVSEKDTKNDPKRETEKEKEKEKKQSRKIKKKDNDSSELNKKQKKTTRRNKSS